MSIQERKIRKSGNSVVLTLSKELLEKIGIQENDYVFVDEDKLAAAITKKSLPSEQELEINRLIDQSFLNMKRCIRSSQIIDNLLIRKTNHKNECRAYQKSNTK